MARSVSDIAMFNKIFSTCNSTLPSVNLSGYRIGYATNWWADLGPEVICCHCTDFTDSHESCQVILVLYCHGSEAVLATLKDPAAERNLASDGARLAYTPLQCVPHDVECHVRCEEGDVPGLLNSMHCWLQTEGVFNRTLEAVKSAGGVLVPFNASGMVDYHDKYIGDSTFYTTELGGALSR